MSVIAPTYTAPILSQTLRARLAPLVSPLRRVTPRVPFWHLAAHRLPTLWSLYRGLLRAAPSNEIRRQVSARFRQKRHLTSPHQTKTEMLKAYRLLDVCHLAKTGNAHAKTLLSRYSGLILAREEKEKWMRAALDAKREMDWLRNRPIVTGYFRPSLYNKPLPRLKPQPAHISMMIRKRRRNRATRAEQYAQSEEWRGFALREVDFERKLSQEVLRTGNDDAGKENSNETSTQPPFEPHWLGEIEAWNMHMREHQRWLRQTFTADAERLFSSFSPRLIECVAAARREKVLNKIRERQREMKGEVLKRTIERARRGLPAWLLHRMSPKKIKLVSVAKSSISEVGYIGHAKKTLGWKVKEDPWRMEDGPEDDQERLSVVETEIKNENQRRRKNWERAAR
ncbi:hypothetical protein BC835DRAFT_1387032 [Cytidiella melzeri]|nr:hypothetical protein BC835DRAFT_1387032 [Cytidiella melzeri]